MKKHNFYFLRSFFFFSFFLILIICNSYGNNINKRELYLEVLSDLRNTEKAEKDSKTISGVIKDIHGEAVVGASIIEVGSSKGTISNLNGSFTLNIKKNATLRISSVGYLEQNIATEGKTKFEIVLEEDIKALEEVVVVAYGTVKKSGLTGSVSQLEMKDVVKAPVTSFSEALAGRVAGVQASSNDGQPGTSTNIVIRGANSLTQSNAPLYVVDGIPYENADAAALNTDDIETISILKDASSTALYGARGANGVIVIETKKGKMGKPIITVNSTYGYQSIQKRHELMGAYEFVKYQDELNIVRNVPDLTERLYYTNGRTLESYKTIEGIDWQKYIIKDLAPFKTMDVAIRGGNSQTTYSMSGSISDQDGILINTGAKTTKARISMEQKFPGKNFSVLGAVASFLGLTSYGPPATSGQFTNYTLAQTWGYRPTASEDVDLFSLAIDPDNNTVNNYRFNPYMSRKNDHTYNYGRNFSSSVYFRTNIFKVLRLYSSGAAAYYNTRYDRFYNSDTPQGSPLLPENTRGINGNVTYRETKVYSTENTLTYRTKINKVHSLDATAGFSAQIIQPEGFGYSSQNLPNDVLGMSGLDEGDVYSTLASISENRMAAFFGRLNYDYKSKYLFTHTSRYDGSSKFSPANRWGYFPSFAFSWNMHKENFMKSISAISVAKWRLSYGITGNNRISDFAYMPQLTTLPTSAYSFNNEIPTTAIVPSNLSNPDLKWESTKQINIGYDMSLFDKRVELTIDIYRKITSDLLLNADIPATMGLLNATKNIGSVENKGLEITINTKNVESKNFLWTSNFNISFNKQRIIKLADGQSQMITSAIVTEPPFISRLNEEAGSFFGYVWDGVYQYEDFDNSGTGLYILKKDIPTNGNARNTIQPGDIKYKDMNGDGIVDAYDKVVIGRSQPIHTGGFSNNIVYKQFDFNVLFQWSYGNEILNITRYQFEGNGSRLQDLNQFATYEKRWSPENPSNTLYRAGGQGPLARASSRLVEDGSYLRLKTVSVGYRVPDKVLKKIGLTNARFHLSAQNLFTLTNYSGLDPEVSRYPSVLQSGMDYCAYPHAQTIVIGTNLTF